MGRTTKAEHPPRATIPLLDLRTHRNVALEQQEGRWPHREHSNATSPSWINGDAFTLQKSNPRQPLPTPAWMHHASQRHPTPLWHGRIYRTYRGSNIQGPGAFSSWVPSWCPSGRGVSLQGVLGWAQLWEIRGHISGIWQRNSRLRGPEA